VTVSNAAEQLIDCDYLFLAADSMRSRLVFNAVVQQYLIPAVQVGAKVQINPESGEILDVFSVVRPLIPGQGCLWCNELILPAKLQEEAVTSEERQRQRYVDDFEVTAPSVITLNAIAASHAVNDYLFTSTGMLAPSGLVWGKFFPRGANMAREILRRDRKCPECGVEGRLAAGSARRLPVRMARM